MGKLILGSRMPCVVPAHLPLQEAPPELVLQQLAVKLGPTFVKLAQTLRWGGGPPGRG